jgi:hypothetical protein
MAYKCITYVVVVMVHAVLINNKTNRLLFQIYRHGDRTPIDPYPNDPYQKNYWHEGLGQLTKVSFVLFTYTYLHIHTYHCCGLREFILGYKHVFIWTFVRECADVFVWIFFLFPPVHFQRLNEYYNPSNATFSFFLDNKVPTKFIETPYHKFQNIFV